MTATLAAVVFVAGLLATAAGIGGSITYGEKKSENHAMAGICLSFLGLLLAFASGVMLP
ncbi:hypothetical protein [Pseudotabrizicola sp. 4114]|uniref:hypothetical protein n=1 Tax=Pseudotabrizicola sp. 4114 TaxID=2817731 RepID=UPI00285B8CEF|nr:uncharacterized membrane protein (UPF0136 family) [Pseudorhodobacter sp. 4114]